MTIIDAIILGIVQGLTEFLPISSSGHLALAQDMLGFSEHDIFTDIILHVGTLFAVVFYFRYDILEIIKSLFAPRIPGTNFLSIDNWMENSGRRMLILLLMASVPTAIIGILGKSYLEAAFSNMVLISVSFFITALLLLSTYFSKKWASQEIKGIKALVIGIVQGIAILPGISRSGSTIAIAMAMKINPQKAARFSFLLSIPAILGALLLKIGDVNLIEANHEALFAGFISSTVVGYLALWMLIAIIGKGKLHLFSVWCVIAGLTALFQI